MVEEAKKAYDNGNGKEPNLAKENPRYLDIEYYRKNNFWLLDSKGTLSTKRKDYIEKKMAAHKLDFCRDDEPINDLLVCIKEVKPTALLGLAGQAAGSFDDEMIGVMTE